jgi:hypothetical protein
MERTETSSFSLSLSHPLQINTKKLEDEIKREKRKRKFLVLSLVASLNFFHLLDPDLIKDREIKGTYSGSRK